ncbi:MAG: hypothetical protein VKK62_05140 [Synechococcaceae cyanobacterium]|nr:hypothetical protein [Synechococcaceae cyanobacterium]
MNRPVVWIWLLLGLIVLMLPGPAGRLLLDLLGGITLLLLLAPLVLAGLGLLAWRVLSSRLRTCPSCGLTSFRSDPAVCPACGWSELDAAQVESGVADPAMGSWGVRRDAAEIPASDITITVTATGVSEDGDGTLS